MKAMWGKGVPVEVYDFEDDNWRDGIVMEPEYEIAGYNYLQVRFTSVKGSDDPEFVWIAPELVERHVRAAG